MLCSDSCRTLNLLLFPSRNPATTLTTTYPLNAPTMYNVKAPQRRPRRHPYTRMSHDNLRLDGFPQIVLTHQPIPRKTSLDENTIRAPKATAPQPTPEFDEATIKARPPLAARFPVQPEAEDLTVRPTPVHPRGNIALFREVLDKVAREARAEEKERPRVEAAGIVG